MKIVFSTGNVHPRDRLAYWREEATKAYVAHEISANPGQSFWGTIRSGSLDILKLSVFDSTGCKINRTQRSLRHDVNDDLLVSMQIVGTKILHQENRDAVLGVGDLVLIDPRRPFSLRLETGHKSLTVRVPRKDLQWRVGDIARLTTRKISGPETALASGFLSMLPERLHAFNEQTRASIAQQTLDLIALALTSNADRDHVRLSSPREAALLRLKAIIEGALHNHALKPADLAAAAGISVRYANSLLAEQGTSLERYVVLRRLERCYRALTDVVQAHRTVSDIAYSHGFSDLSHFTRRFKARFGCVPSECRPRH